MIEKILYDYMKTAMGAIPVYMEVPQKPPDTFVVMEKTGSGLRDGIFSATIAVQSYATSMFNAADLNESAKTAMLAAVTLDDVSAVRLNSDYNFTDTASKAYRYQAVFDVYHY